MGKTVKDKTLKSRRMFLWQLRAFFSAGILYLFFYFCKYDLSAATPGIKEEFGFSDGTFGWILTAFLLVYAFGQFVNGFLGDRYGPKRILIIGALGGVTVNVLFAFGGHIAGFAGLTALAVLIVLWSINGYFSSMGWAPVCRIMYNWFPENRWGTWMGWANFLCYFGAFLVFPIATFAIKHWGWRAAFLVSPTFLLGMTIIFFWLGRSSPQEAGLDPEWDQKLEKPTRRVGAREYWIAFTNMRMNLSYLCGMCANFVRWGLLSWGVRIFEAPVEEGGFGLDIVVAGWVVAMASLGGALFSLLCGVVSDRVFKGIRWQTITIGCLLSSAAIFFIAQGASILSISVFGVQVGLSLLFLAMFVGGGLIQAIQTPLFDLPGDILGKEVGGTGAGIMDGWMYVGAAFSGFYLGGILDNYGLTTGLTFMAGASVVSGLLAIAIRK
jgi:OPA family glycerol-3-phosphate transporter-like MFS transporter